jgi:hypothetical protein
MGVITKDTFKRLYLLYLINEFKNGVYGKLRLEKISYFIEREFKIKFFEYKWYHYGQYSEDLSDILEQLISMGFVSSSPLDTERGNKYKIRAEIQDYSPIISIIPGLIEKTKKIVGIWGYASEQIIIKHAYSFSEIKKLKYDDKIFDENLPDKIELKSFNEETCEELNFSFNPEFIASIEKINRGIEESDFDISKVKTVDSLL